MSYSNNNFNHKRNSGGPSQFEEVDFQNIQEKRSNGQFVSATTLSKAITKEVKITCNFDNGETLFQYLVNLLKIKQNSRPDYKYVDHEIIAFQRAVSTLVRYAPSTYKARYYVCLVLTEYSKPLRSVPLELTLLINLLYIYSSKGDERHMKDALEIVKLALEIGVFELDLSKENQFQNQHFNDPQEVFETMARKVLRYFRLDFNEGKTEIRQSTRQFSR